MKVLITGSSGLVGSALCDFLEAEDHQVLRLRRRSPATSQDRFWDPDKKVLDISIVENIDAVVHLAGENLSSGRWTAAKKQRIRDSRVGPTSLLSDALARAHRPPKLLFSASAMGYYGDRGDEILIEDSPPGTGFLAEVCHEWEEATETAQRLGIRVCHLRFGMILSGKGGALPKMLLPFKLGLGGIVGSGNQFWSWISLQDVVGVIDHLMKTQCLAGAINVSAPEPVTNREFTKALGRVLHRPTVFPLPASAARIVLGDMAEMLLTSSRLKPAKLEQIRYPFVHSDLEATLRHLLHRA